MIMNGAHWMIFMIVFPGGLVLIRPKKIQFPNFVAKVVQEPR